MSMSSTHSAGGVQLADDRPDADHPKLAFVWASGEAESARGSLGGRYLRERPQLLGLTRAVLHADVDSLGFVWAGPTRDLVRVRVTVTTQDSPEPYACVVMTPTTGLPHGITLRELDVLTLLVGGLGNAEIATRLRMSPRTATTHIDRLFAKLNLNSRTAAATLAMTEGLIVLPIPGGPAGFERVAHGRVASAAADGVIRRPPSRTIAKAPMLLGTALPMSGPARDDGLEMLRGTKLAVEEINRRGGVGGRPIEIAVEDVDVTDPDSIRQVFSALANREVDALTSGYLGRQDIAHEASADYGRPYLHAATLNSMVEQVVHDPSRYGRIFQVCPSDVLYGPGFVRTVTELRDRRTWRPHSRELLVLQGSWPMGDLGFEQTCRDAERHGWTMRPLFPVGVSDTNWQQAARAVRENPPAALMVGHYFVEGTVAFLHELMTDPPPTLLYTLYSPSVPSFREELGALAEGLLWATVSGTYSDALGRGFAQRYKSAYRAIPGRSHAGIAYDRTNIIADAWARCGNPRNSEQVAQQLRAMVHRGVNGSYQFAQPGQSGLAYPDVTMDPSIGQAHLLFQIQDRRHQILSPGPYANAEFRLPAWLGADGRKSLG
jgi:branched-chain amino acid transport system substrate-binding protein